jgi:mannitol-specific phosphotransferase system IIBC component
MSSRARIGIVAAAVVALVVAFLIINGSKGDDDKKSSSSNDVVTVVDAKPQGGVQQLKFTKGDTIKFTVKSDTADEIHFHGYDVHQDVKAGGQVTFSVPATIEGRFIVELEDHKTQIAEVEVDPS